MSPMVLYFHLEMDIHYFYDTLTLKDFSIPSCWPKIHLKMKILLVVVWWVFLMDFNFLWLKHYPPEGHSVNIISFPFNSVFTIDLWGAVIPSSDFSPSCTLSQALGQPHHSSHNSFWSFNSMDAINWFSKWRNYTMKYVAWTRVAILENNMQFVTSVSHHSSSIKLKLRLNRHQTVKIYTDVRNILFLYIQPAINYLFLTQNEEKCRIL